MWEAVSFWVTIVLLSGCGWLFHNRKAPPWFGRRDTNKLCWPLTCLSVRFQSTFSLTAFPKCLHTWVTESRVLKSKLVPWYSETVARNPAPLLQGKMYPASTWKRCQRWLPLVTLSVSITYLQCCLYRVPVVGRAAQCTPQLYLYPFAAWAPSFSMQPQCKTRSSSSVLRLRHITPGCNSSTVSKSFPRK